ncbi:Methyltransferase domain-containing protein [Arboricoccus pini]|uniref:Methyltransferase domain-containing protein n=1 Tax=Arboricoccus pini TaxID=1963835 RepID=A0A212R4Q4_9PROT|nr:class I SAM-dependent methyltransferase [Arboricoccus pini]SNB66817.1 Methyltransferase domain-containing protein [Arboricoccus pini]
MQALVRRLDGRYQACGHATRGYVRWKLRLDPVHAPIFAQARNKPLGHVLDLGCGLGQFGLALLELGLATGVTGFDWDEALIRQARLAATGLPAHFHTADLRLETLPPSQCTLILDLLYQLPLPDQEDLLRRAARVTADRLFLRALDPDRGWRSRVGRGAERLSRLARLYRPAEIAPTPLKQFEGWLDAEGFVCEVEPCWGVTPFPNVLLTARRQSP